MINKSQPLVSIIMPCYNVAPFIKVSLDSVLKQTYTNLEILIIDDFSNDNTLNIVKNFSDDRLSIYTNDQNLGISQCLNTLVQKSKGEYICRMDADDIMHPKKIFLQIEYMLKNNIDFCGSFIRFFGTENKTIKYPILNHDIRFFMVFGSPFAHPSIICKAKILKANIYLNNVAEDYYLWTRIATSKTIIKFGNLPKVLLSYRRHEKQLTSSFKFLIEDSINISKKFSKFYIKNDLIYSELCDLNFGMNNEYNIKEFFILTENLIKLGNVNKVSSHIMFRLTNSFIKRVKVLSFLNIISTIILLYKNKVSIFDRNLIYILIIYFIRKIKSK